MTAAIMQQQICVPSVVNQMTSTGCAWPLNGLCLAPRTPIYGLGIMASLSLGLLQGSSSMGIVYRVYVSSLSSDSGHLLRQRKAR
jgi:hypothetical protein